MPATPEEKAVRRAQIALHVAALEFAEASKRYVADSLDAGERGERAVAKIENAGAELERRAIHYVRAYLEEVKISLRR